MEPRVEQIVREFSSLDTVLASETRHVSYRATVYLDKGQPYRVSGIFYLYAEGAVDFSVHYARRIGGSRRAPPSVNQKVQDAIMAHEERTCWTCLRTQVVGPNNEKCPACDGVGVHRG